MAASLALRPLNCALLSAREQRPISTSKRAPKKLTSLTSPPSLTPNPNLPPKKVLIPIAFGTEEMEAVILADVLRRAGADVLLASVEPGLQVEGSSGTKIEADAYIFDCADEVFDLMALPGGVTGAERLHKSKVLERLLKEQKAGGRVYGGICSSAAILQKQRLIMDKVTASHPEVVSKLTGQVSNEADIVIDGKLITGRGLGTTIDFSLAIVHKLFGHGRARSVAEGIVFEYGKS